MKRVLSARRCRGVCGVRRVFARAKEAESPSTTNSYGPPALVVGRVLDATTQQPIATRRLCSLRARRCTRQAPHPQYWLRTPDFVFLILRPGCIHRGVGAGYCRRARHGRLGGPTQLVRSLKAPRDRDDRPLARKQPLGGLTDDAGERSNRRYRRLHVAARSDRPNTRCAHHNVLPLWCVRMRQANIGSSVCAG